MKAFHFLGLAVSAAIAAPSNSPRGLDPRACCTVKICDGFKLSGKCYTGCYPKIDEIILDPYWQKNAGSWKVTGNGFCGCHARPNSPGGGTYCTVEKNGNLGACMNNMASFHCEFNP